MNNFDQRFSGEHNFAKSNPQFLKSMFGATGLTPLWLADMDFKVPIPIINEIKRLADRGNFSYEFNTAEVFQAISSWNRRRNKLELDPKHFVQVPGVLSGIALLIRELTKEDDGILVQTPVYHQFFQLIKTANRKLVDNPLQLVNGKYEMDFPDLEKKLRLESVKAMILCNPHNPVGRVWNKTELERLVQLANENGVTIISDEIHSDIVYAPNEFNSLASIKAGANHVSVLGSPAKAFGMHSIANGYLYISNVDLHSSVKSTVSSMFLDHGNAISGYATLAAYNDSEEWIDELISYLKDTIHWIKGHLKTELPMVKMIEPEGTYQIWLDFSGLQKSTAELNNLLVAGANLALTPGNWFGESHQQFMRINIASPLAEIQKAFTNLSNAIDRGPDGCDIDPLDSSPCCG